MTMSRLTKRGDGGYINSAVASRIILHILLSYLLIASEQHHQHNHAMVWPSRHLPVLFCLVQTPKSVSRTRYSLFKRCRRCCGSRTTKYLLENLQHLPSPPWPWCLPWMASAALFFVSIPGVPEKVRRKTAFCEATQMHMWRETIQATSKPA